MTTKIQIEDTGANGCTCVVQMWDKGRNGEPDVMVSAKLLFGATGPQDFCIHANRYLVIKEIR